MVKLNQSPWFVAISHLVPIYAIAFGVWGLAFWHVIWFVLIGALIGLLLGLLSGAITSGQATIERKRDMVFASGAIWGGLATIIGVLGIIISLIKFLFFQ